MNPYRFQRGETIVVMLQAVGANPSDLAIVDDVAAELKPADNSAFVPDVAVAPVAQCEVVAALAPTDPTQLPGWYLTIAAARSATLSPGTYVTNAVLTLAGGSIEKTDPLFLQIDQATS